MTREIRIASYASLLAAASPDFRARVVAGLDAIFFETAGPRAFDDEAERVAFRDRWLGRYLDHLPHLALVALKADGVGAGRPVVAGYLVGAVRDPARDPLFADVPYFPGIADLTPHYPAHLHINLGSRWRGTGLGSRLVARFGAMAQARGARGLHVVTGQQARNRSFYRRVGLVEVRALSWAGGSGVMMAARLPLKPSPPASE